MLKIAIVDDVNEVCSQIDGYLLQIEKELCVDMDIEVYYLGTKFVECLVDNNRYDIIFLDIELDRYNGVDIGKIIRNELNDYATQIIYISGKTHYAMQLFQNRPFDFVEKPINYSIIKKCIVNYLTIYDNRKMYFEYYKNRKKIMIDINNIIYFESVRKQIHIRTVDDDIYTYGKLSDISQFDGYNIFLRIHQSYLVNASHISEYSYDKIRLSNGEELFISRSHQKNVQSYIVKTERIKMIN